MKRHKYPRYFIPLQSIHSNIKYITYTSYNSFPIRVNHDNKKVLIKRLLLEIECPTHHDKLYKKRYLARSSRGRGCFIMKIRYFVPDINSQASDVKYWADNGGISSAFSFNNEEFVGASRQKYSKPWSYYIKHRYVREVDESELALII